MEGFSGFLTEFRANIVAANSLPAQGTTEEDYEKQKDILEDAFNKSVAHNDGMKLAIKHTKKAL